MLSLAAPTICTNYTHVSEKKKKEANETGVGKQVIEIVVRGTDEVAKFIRGIIKESHADAVNGGGGNK